MNKKQQYKKDKSGEVGGLLKLTPRVLKDDEKKRIEPYLNRLKQAIDQEDILNIALTGNYGSGKSTILRTFENEYSEYKYLPISLASFNDDQEISKSKRKEENGKNKLTSKKKTKLQQDIEQQLEISILQQIFYKVSADKIPDSRFKRIKDFDNKKTTKFIVLSAIWVISAFILFGFDYIHDLNPRGWDLDDTVSWVAIFSVSFFVFGLSYLMKFGYRSFSNSKINKFSVKGEIELGEASVFNKYLDEILYFFERTDFNVVVFEDIDRFDTTDIFTKLRELNKLINHCDLIDRDINFVYAVKDTVFKDKTERVKFFDFIIPVIPFVNSKNASEQLNKLIQKHELTDKLSKKFVSEVVSMIHDIDMRLLINTFHEYTVFKENIGEEDINHEGLFSIIVYKNLYPEDFSDLYREKGKLFNVISKREENIEILSMEIENEIQNLEDEIEHLDQHSHIQIDELRAIYILRFLESLSGTVTKVLIGGVNVKIIDLVDDKYFKAIQEMKNVEYEYLHNGYNRRSKSNLAFKDIEGLVNHKYSYSEREQMIRDIEQNKVNSIQNEILAKKKQIREIKKLSLAEILKKMETEEIYGDFKDNDLVRYFLTEGYLNENYIDYISLFHEVNLTIDEFKYLRSIKSNKNPEYDFKISNHYTIIRDLDARFFLNKSILNYDLVEYLVNHSSQFPEKVSMLYASFNNREKIYLNFIVFFLEEKSSCRRKFIPNLIKHRKSFWDEIKHPSKLPREKIRKIVKYLFEYTQAENLQNLDNVSSLISYLSNINKPISFGASLSNTVSLKDFLSANLVKFRSIEEPDNSTQNFFDYVINKNQYEINYPNVITILKNKLSEFEEGDIQKAIYSYISELELTDVKEYLEENINEFVSKVLLHKNISNSESEESLITLLNNEDLESQFKAELIGIQKHKISSLDSLINYETKEIVTSANKIKPTWNNVYHYYDQLDESFLNETIISFLNKEENYVELSDHSVFDVEGVDEKLLLRFRDNLLYSTSLDLNTYKNLLKSLLPIDSVDYSQINQEMAEILLEENILKLNSHNFDGLKSLDGSLHIRLIEKNIQELVEDIITMSFDDEDWYSILNSKQITRSHKRELLFYLSTENLSNSKVAKKVIELHPKEKIEKYGFDKIKVLLSHDVSIKGRIALLLNYINDFNNDQLEAILSQFGDDYADLFGLWKKPTFPNDEAHLEFLEELKNRGIISSFSKSGDEIRAYCRRKK